MNAPDVIKAVLDYHEATKHRFDGFALGPGFLDWATQPDPFRRYPGARLIRLERIAPTDAPNYDAVFTPGQRPAAAPVNRHTLSQLFYDSLALSAWKRSGASRWALRVNASSGNLHPTEGYLVCGPIAGLCERPMVCHYAPKPHGLEVRAGFDIESWQALCAGFPDDTFFLALSSIHWREAWKYGQRAYRYCMHDAGHALAALAIAAAGLGWQTRLLDDIGTAELASLLGTSQPHAAEPEEPDLLLACMPTARPPPLPALSAGVLRTFTSLAWQGRANRLSPSHVAWGMEAIAAQVRRPHVACAYDPVTAPPRSLAPRQMPAPTAAD